jgi:hypothetical protein
LVNNLSVEEEIGSLSLERIMEKSIKKKKQKNLKFPVSKGPPKARKMHANLNLMFTGIKSLNAGICPLRSKVDVPTIDTKAKSLNIC